MLAHSAGDARVPSPMGRNGGPAANNNIKMSTEDSEFSSCPSGPVCSVQFKGAHNPTC